jgi:hypothetical protein
MNHYSLGSCLTLLFLLGCSSVDDDALCDGTITLAVTSTVPDAVSADLLVSGTASITRNTAIRHVTVGGLQATPDGFNFSEWSVTVPFASLLAATPEPGEPDQVSLPVVASPSCGEAGKTTVSVRLNRRPEVRVESLEITPAFPAQGGYLPADGKAAAIVTVSGNAEARGGTVVVEVTGPGQIDNLGSSGSVVLAGDGSSEASASVLVRSTGPGTVFVSAKSGSSSAKPISFEAASAPRIFPDEATLAPGQTLVVDVLPDVEAQVITCRVREKGGISVEEITQGEEYELTADAELESAAEVRLSCEDDYGQEVSATFTAAPAEEAEEP